MGHCQYFPHLLSGVQEPEINTSSLQGNQSSDSGSVDCVNLAQVENDISRLLPHNRAQNRSFMTPYNSAQATQNYDPSDIFGSYRQHAHSPEAPDLTIRQL
jgi:hypothetical protein